jgi:hypothetical protein
MMIKTRYGGDIIDIDVEGYWIAKQRDIFECPGRKNVDYRIGIAHQNKVEIESFIEILKGVESRKIALEIGLMNGGTHLIWRSLFSQVASIEISFPSVLAFGVGITKGSLIFNGDSTNSVTSGIVRRKLGDGIDFLFIDGCHKYNAVVADYANYEPLVRSGGIVAFHNIHHVDVQRFLYELEDGSHPLVDFEIKIIRISNDGPGIGYFVKK